MSLVIEKWFGRAWSHLEQNCWCGSSYKGSIALEIEFLAILRALDLSSYKEWIRKGTLIVESDSKVVLTWSKSSCPWKLWFYGNKMKNIQWRMGNVTLSHKTRESNEIADSLAKEGASSYGSWVKWCNLVCERPESWEEASNCPISWSIFSAALVSVDAC